MATSVVRGADALQNEVEKARESLKGADEKIRKLTGREPGENRVNRRPSGGDFRGGRDRIFNLARRGLTEDGGPRRRPLVAASAFTRLGPMAPMERRNRPRGHDSGDEDELPNKPAIQSSVIATPQDSKTRSDKVNTLNKDEKGKARNRRMFGNLLVGTLLRFQDEAKTKKDTEVKRKEVEQKLEMKQREEQDEVRRERRQAFTERRQKQFKLRRLEQKMWLVEMHNRWETETRKLGLFPRTRAKPHIYYKPKKVTEEVKKRIVESAKIVDELIEQHKQNLEKQIEEIMTREAEDDQHDGDDNDNEEMRNESEAEEEGEIADDAKSKKKRKLSEYEEDKDPGARDAREKGSDDAVGKVRHTSGEQNDRGKVRRTSSGNRNASEETKESGKRDSRYSGRRDRKESLGDSKDLSRDRRGSSGGRERRSSRGKREEGDRDRDRKGRDRGHHRARSSSPSRREERNKERSGREERKRRTSSSGREEKNDKKPAQEGDSTEQQVEKEDADNQKEKNNDDNVDENMDQGHSDADDNDMAEGDDKTNDRRVVTADGDGEDERRVMMEDEEDRRVVTQEDEVMED